MSFNYTGYICKDKDIKNIFLWSGDFSNLIMNGAYKIKSHPDICGYCDKKCPPKKVRVTVEEIL